MSGFSAAVKIGDLDDFLSPATDCVILPAKPEVSKRSSASVIKSTPKQEDNVASITLSDCLACSGCVTSAETVLLQSQSVDELLSLSQSSPKKIYFSVSSASRRALSEFYKIPPGRVCRYLEASLSKVLSPSSVYVLDTSVAESIVVEETRREMLDRKQVLITSHCPGWSCYATKVLDESILSHMSRVKSPEQLMGLIVKRLIPCILAQTKFFRTSQIRNLRHFFSAPNDEILHVLISPCFDKKLEIIRPDYTTTEKVKAVDLVLATSELLDLMSRTTHIDRNNIKESKEMFDIHEMFSLRDSWAVSESGCDSGGYAQAALTRMGNYDWMHEKNKDILKLENSIRSHGFRNIQNITRRLASDKLKEVNIVELMACPGGCPRGGGQPPVKETAKPIISILDRIFSTTSTPAVNTHEVDYVCAPSEYIPGKIIRDSISKFLGADFLSEFLTTEWKSTISQKHDDTNGIHPSSVRW